MNIIEFPPKNTFSSLTKRPVFEKNDIENLIKGIFEKVENEGDNALKFYAEKLEILERLLFRIQAVLKSKNTKYILMNVPNEKIQEVSSILPVLKSPTIVPLVEEGWSSLHSVIEEKRFWEVIDQLKKAGAEGILIIPIEKMIL